MLSFRLNVFCYLSLDGINIYIIIYITIYIYIVSSSIYRHLCVNPPVFVVLSFINLTLVCVCVLTRAHFLSEEFSFVSS